MAVGNSRHRFLRHSELFKRIRDQVNSRDQVFALLRDMQTDVDTYLANQAAAVWRVGQFYQ